MRLLFVFVLVICYNNLYSNDTTKTALTTRTSVKPKIDGFKDNCYNIVSSINDFIQYVPINNVEPTQKTEVSIIYDDNAIYIFAQMYDTSPDSILTQLGNRDDEDLNSDFFGIEFDTYNNQLDAYSFFVTASGVQSDFREFDNTYNAVWESKTKITANGWTAEIKIPFSAIRFPKTEIQTWGLEIQRNIRRKRETDMWALQKKGSQNNLFYWGKLKGLENIKAPLRLSVTPYVSFGIQSYKTDTWKNSQINKNITEGLDLKYGINEAFTLDLTLLPDFSQVKSDNKVKNLSAFETVYQEQRPFFNEAVDLFSKGNLFYSRRIGKTPTYYYDVENMIDSNETISKNPSQAQLINAFKVSGRNKNNLAIGVFNAITNDTWAVVKNNNGTERKILTEPWANYNIIVVDQALKNNSSVFISNSNFFRDKNFYNSDVVCGGLNLVDKTNTWSLNTKIGSSNFYYRAKQINNETIPKSGLKYSISASKVNGNFQFGLGHSFLDKNYDANDIGLTQLNNNLDNNVWFNYNIYEPFGVFRSLYNNISFYNSFYFSERKISNLSISYNGWTTFKNYLSIWLNSYLSLYKGYDYYEPRIEGRYFRRQLNSNISFGFSSDYRKTFALDGDLTYGPTPANNEVYKDFSITPIIRLSDHIIVKYSFFLSNDNNEKGWTEASTNDSIIFGNRNVTNVINTFTGKYIIINDLSISANVRHYWSKGVYNGYYLLNNSGLLDDINNNYYQNFNYNAFNIDFVVSWQFAPGSNLSFVWKKEILNESNVVISNFKENLSNTFDMPQWNTFSIRAIYYLDYQYFKRKEVH